MKIRLFNIGWNVSDENGNDINSEDFSSLGIELPDEVIIDEPDDKIVEAAEETLRNHEVHEDIEDYLQTQYEAPVYEVGVEILR